MQMVKIHVPDRADSARCLVEVSGHGRVIGLPGNVYIVPEPALALLDSLGIHYVEQERGGLDYAEKALRDSLAAHVQ